ncbi:MAG: TIGR02391 family protein [Candidatus Nanopelagicales bacterium]
MTSLNIEWAIEQLDTLISQTDLVPYSDPSIIGSHTRADEEDIAAQAQVAEKILARVLPRWRAEVPIDQYQPWNQHREAAIRARAELMREHEVRENLGDNAPEISAANLHPWVWDGARSLWQSGHFRSAVEDAAKKVNAETQNKAGRRDLSETKLFQEAFSEKPAQSGNARLRRMANDGSDTYRSVQRGAMALAEGIYAGIRNPFNHEDPKDIDEQTALEYLAALSVLARWVDDSTVEVAA